MRTTRTAPALAIATVAAMTVAAAPTASAQPSTDSLMPPQTCDVDVNKLAADTPVPDEWKDWHKGWEVGQVENIGGDLGFVVLETQGGTGGAPSKVILFHRCAPTNTQPSGTSRARVTSHTNFTASVGFKANLSDVATADQPYDHTLWVWNPIVGDAQGLPLPPGVSL